MVDHQFFFGLYQFALYSEEGPVLGFVIAIATFLLIAGTLWFFARWLAPLFYPYEDQDDVPISFDVDRLEVVILQIIGLILVLIGLNGLLSALLGIFVATIDQDLFPSGTTIFLSLTKGALFGILGLILLIKFRVILHWLSRLRNAGAS